MCKDIAPEHMESYLNMFDRAKILETEIEEALDKGLGNQTELVKTKEFLAERSMYLEAMAGALNNTHILVTPYAELLRGTNGQ